MPEGSDRNSRKKKAWIFCLFMLAAVFASVVFAAMENVNHPWMIGVQFHPEFLSRPVRPHPLFRDFIAAALKRKNG